MNNNLINIDVLSPEDFINLAASNKIALIDALAAKMLDIGYRAAEAGAEYFQAKLTNKENPQLPFLTARRAKLDGEYDAIKHAVSALQSTLRAERELSE